MAPTKSEKELPGAPASDVVQAIDILAKKNVELHRENSILKRDNQGLKESNEELKYNHNRLNDRHESLKDVNKMLEQQVKELEKGTAELEITVAKMNGNIETARKEAQADWIATVEVMMEERDEQKIQRIRLAWSAERCPFKKHHASDNERNPSLNGDTAGSSSTSDTSAEKGGKSLLTQIEDLTKTVEAMNKPNAKRKLNRNGPNSRGFKKMKTEPSEQPSG